MKLFEINRDILALLEAVDPETGEMDEFVADRLVELQMAFEDKAEGVALYIKTLDAEAKAIKEQEELLRQRRAAKENRRDSLKKYLLNQLEYNGVPAIETARCRITIRRTQKVDIVEPELISKAYLRIKRTEEPDKVKIAEALKAGKKVRGAQLVPSQSLQIK